MKILRSTEMAAADQATFARLGVASLAVMETAGRACAQLICELFQARLARGVAVVDLETMVATDLLLPERLAISVCQLS